MPELAPTCTSSAGVLDPHSRIALVPGKAVTSGDILAAGHSHESKVPTLAEAVQADFCDGRRTTIGRVPTLSSDAHCVLGMDTMQTREF
jgi:hypothetical protein